MSPINGSSIISGLKAKVSYICCRIIEVWPLQKFFKVALVKRSSFRMGSSLLRMRLPFAARVKQ